MSYQPVLSSERPRLALFIPEEDGSDPPEISGEDPSSRCITPQATLTRFFRVWYLPIVLSAERAAQQSTVLLYHESLQWWARITGDPPLNKIDEYTLALFQEGLRNATWRRGVAGTPRNLSKASQVKHLRNIRAVLHRVGPTLDTSRPAKGLLDKTPHLRVPEIKYRLKPCFTLTQCRLMIAATREMRVPEVPGMRTAEWWRTRLALCFYTGQRIGTLRRLTWGNMVPDDSGQYWLEIPAELVTKTQKEARIIVHPKLREALEYTRQTKSKLEPLTPEPYTHRWFSRLHDRLQLLAGIPPERHLSPHAWRRTHSDQLAQLGLSAVSELCRSALDHADARTTMGHYTDITNKFRLRLPNLW